MSDSRKPRGHFLDDSRSVGKQNIKDIKRGRKFDWRTCINEEDPEYSEENVEEREQDSV